MSGDLESGCLPEWLGPLVEKLERFFPSTGGPRLDGAGVQQAQQLASEGKWAEALAVFEAAFVLPQDSAAAIAFLRQGGNEKGAQVLAGLMSLRGTLYLNTISPPSNVGVYVTDEGVPVRARLIENATRHAHLMAEAYHDDPDLLVKAAIMLFGIAHEGEQANNLAKQALKLDPNHAGALNFLDVMC